MSLVIGVDPSKTSTGIVVLNGDEVVEARTLQPKKSQSDLDVAIWQQYHFGCFLNDFRADTDLLLFEDYIYMGSKRLAAAVTIGTALRMITKEIGVTFETVAVTQVKKFALAKGKRQKQDMKLAVYKRWGFEHDSDDVVDAYVIARIAQALAHPENDYGLTKPQNEVLKKLRS